MKLKRLLAVVLIFAGLGFGGEWLVKSRHRFLGYLLGEESGAPISMLSAIPDGQSGVTALVAADNGDLYGGTTATVNRTCYVFRFTNTSNLVTSVAPLDGKIKDQTGIKNAMALGPDGFVYGGTTRYRDELYPHKTQGPDKSYAGGHLFRFKAGEKIVIEDLGLVLANEGVRAVAIDSQRRKLYGLTEPSYKFFIYDLERKSVSVNQKTDLLKKEDNTFMYFHLGKLGRAITVGADGRVYGSAYGSRLFIYDPKSDELKVSDILIPYSLGHEEINAVSSFAWADDTTLYGGTYTDGILFKYNSLRGTMSHLGKPDAGTFIRSLAVTRDGTVCGAVGQEGMPTFIFKYKNGAYEMVGQIRCNIFKTDYNWYFSDLGPAAYLKEGTLFFGEQGRLGKLVAYFNN